VFGPLSLVGLLITWVALLILGFTLLQWGAGSGVRTAAGQAGWLTDLYASGSTIFTLTPGDISPVSAPARVLFDIEGGAGLGIVAMVIGYLPSLSQAFSRRERYVSMLDARAGSPPSAGELLLRHTGRDGQTMLRQLLEQWEQWSADLLETHLSFPVLAYYRSQHSNQSWVAALTAILDVCALIVAGVESEPQRAARLTLAMARHAAADLTFVLRIEPRTNTPDRMPPGDWAGLRQALRDAGLTVKEGPDTEARLRHVRALYEPYMTALAAFLAMPLPQWRAAGPARDNWRALV
jgi:hypothetical protein